MTTPNTRTARARRPAHPVARGVAVALTVLALGACSSDDDDDPIDGTADGMTDGTVDGGVDGTADAGGDDDGATDGTVGTNGSPTGSFAVVGNPSDAPGSIQILSPDLATQAALLQDTANEGTAYGPDGTLYQNGDAEGRTGLFVVGADGGVTQIGAAGGKGLSYITGQDLLASCDVTDAGADLKLFDPTAAADAAAAPVRTIDLVAPCWDTFWDEGNGRLYAALTDGRLAILDDFAGIDRTVAGIDLTAGTAVDRTVTPADGTATNFHGVFAENGMVLVSDVGAVTSGANSDGLLFVFDDTAGTIDGDVEATSIGGPATMLGNPVDVVLLDGAAIVAEKTNDALLVFEGVADLSGDVAPDYQQAFTKPESIELAPTSAEDDGGDETTDATDGEAG